MRKTLTDCDTKAVTNFRMNLWWVERAESSALKVEFCVFVSVGN